MKVVYRLPNNLSCEKELPDGGQNGFCLGDNNGGYLWLADKPSSRYQGWYLNLTPGKRQPLKIIENVEIDGGAPVSAIINYLWRVKRVRGPLTEEFFLPAQKNSLVYRVSEPASLKIIFDVKELFDNGEFGRDYNVEIFGNAALISFRRQQTSPPVECFIAVKSDAASMEILNQWVRRDYGYDRRRGSKPDVRFVYSALSLKASLAVIACGKNRQAAIETAENIFRGAIREKSRRRRDFEKRARFWLDNLGLGKIQKRAELAAAALCAAAALDWLCVKPGAAGGGAGLCAGWPWFFQFWERDETVSCGGLAYVNPAAVVKILFRQLSGLENGTNFSGGADGSGWLFFRLGQFIDKGRLYAAETRLVAGELEKQMARLESPPAGGFILAGPKQTWMDSADRPPAPVEIQALAMNMRRLAAKIGEIPSRREFWHRRDADLFAATKKIFFNGVSLADGYDPALKRADWSVRPNIFLAAYVYPRLLSKNQWEACFDGALARLWLDWGGLSSIDKNDPRFHPLYSGEYPASYHNGDSWFYLNNVAALVLHKLNAVKYHNFVKKIFAASLRGVLWGQVPGCPAELSSAAKFEPAGCFNQAWSGATFLELLAAIGKEAKAGHDFDP